MGGWPRAASEGRERGAGRGRRRGGGGTARDPTPLMARVVGVCVAGGRARVLRTDVEGNMDDFLAYVAAKRQNAARGDDPEVQALCEPYDRPAEIWAYEASTARECARPTRTAARAASAADAAGATTAAATTTRSQPAEPVPSAPRSSRRAEDAAIKRAELRDGGRHELDAPLRRGGDRAGRGRDGAQGVARGPTRSSRTSRPRSGVARQLRQGGGRAHHAPDRGGRPEDGRAEERLGRSRSKARRCAPNRRTMWPKAAEARSIQRLEADDRDLISAALQESINDDEMQAALKASFL